MEYVNSDLFIWHHYPNFVSHMCACYAVFLVIAVFSIHEEHIISLHLIFLWPVCSEESKLIFKYHFLTILLPIDRLAEMGPSRTFFSDDGFTCLQLLDHIYAFYQVRLEEFPSCVYIFFSYA